MEYRTAAMVAMSDRDILKSKDENFQYTWLRNKSQLALDLLEDAKVSSETRNDFMLRETKECFTKLNSPDTIYDQSWQQEQDPEGFSGMSKRCTQALKQLGVEPVTAKRDRDLGLLFSMPPECNGTSTQARYAPYHQCYP